MKYMLPHHFKKIGVIIAPLGFLVWTFMQLGYVTKLCVCFLGQQQFTYVDYPPYFTINVVVAMISFFSFLAGIYFITFSKEKIEDEMVQRTRLESFQYAAFSQIILILLSFISFTIIENPDSYLLGLFTLLVLIFWLTFIIRFNYILHVKLKQ